jgi:fucose 4-O-acetylase-like acetyltransferase
MSDADVNITDVDESVEWIFGVILSLSATAVGSLGRILLRLTHLVKSKTITKWGENSLCIFCFGVFCLIVNPAMVIFAPFH